MQRGRRLIVVAAGIGAVSLLLPFFRADTLGTISGYAAHGSLSVVALLGATIVAISGDRRESLGGLAAVAAGAAVTLAAVLAGAVVIDALLASRDAAAVGAAASVQAGLWIFAGACLLAIGGVVLAMSRRLS